MCICYCSISIYFAFATCCRYAVLGTCQASLSGIFCPRRLTCRHRLPSFTDVYPISARLVAESWTGFHVEGPKCVAWLARSRLLVTSSVIGCILLRIETQRMQIFLSFLHFCATVLESFASKIASKQKRPRPFFPSVRDIPRRIQLTDHRVAVGIHTPCALHEKI